MPRAGLARMFTLIVTVLELNIEFSQAIAQAQTSFATTNHNTNITF